MRRSKIYFDLHITSGIKKLNEFVVDQMYEEYVPFKRQKKILRMDIERDIILKVFDRERGNTTTTAKKLGMWRWLLHWKLAAWSIAYRAEGEK